MGGELAKEKKDGGWRITYWHFCGEASGVDGMSEWRHQLGFSP